jgi:hypothetical protein
MSKTGATARLILLAALVSCTPEATVPGPSAQADLHAAAEGDGHWGQGALLAGSSWMNSFPQAVRR